MGSTGTVDTPCSRQSSPALRVQKQEREHNWTRRDRGHPTADSPLLRQASKNRSVNTMEPAGTVDTPCCRQSSPATRVQKQKREYNGTRWDRGHPLLQKVLSCVTRQKTGA